MKKKKRVAQYHLRALFLLIPVLLLGGLPEIAGDLLPTFESNSLFRGVVYSAFMGTATFLLFHIDPKAQAGKLPWFIVKNEE